MRKWKSRTVVVLVTMAFLVGSWAVPASAAVGDIVERPVPNSPGGLNRITTGPDGNIWFTKGGANQIGRMTPAGAFTAFDIPTPDSSPIDITTGPDGALWFTEFTGRIGRITTTGGITEYPVFTQGPGKLPRNQRVFLFGITVGPDGALWFTANCCDPAHFDGFIGRITTSGVITRYPLAPRTSPTVGITTGPDGNIWYGATNVSCRNEEHACSQRIRGRIQRMSPAGVVTGDFIIPTPYSDPSRIVAAPDGNLWFTEQGAIGANGCCEPTFPAPGKIGRITTAGVITEFQTPPNSVGSNITNPAGIAVGPDGNVWWTEYSYLTRPRGTEPGGVLHGGNRIGRVNIGTGAITEFDVPTAHARADGITKGPAGDRNLYFTESPGNFASGAVGRIQALP